MDDQDLLLSETAVPMNLRTSQATRGTSSLGGDEKRGWLACQSPSPASPMDLDDLVSEILLRLPPLPSSLPRASLVCTRWRRLVTEPSFTRRFRAHHWRPLGVFLESGEDLSFRFISHPRYPAPPRSLSVRVRRECHEEGDGGKGYIWVPHGCRHGRVVLAHGSRGGHGTRQFLVWNPVTGEDHLLDVTQFLDHGRDHRRNQNVSYMKGAVICAPGDKGPFKFALAWDNIHEHSVHICVYSSETGVWGNVVSAAFRFWTTVGRGNVMVGNTLYWILFGHQVRVLQFHLGSQSLAVIAVPPYAFENHRGVYLCTLAEGGGPSLIVMSADLRAQLWVWERNADSDGDARWMLGRTIELDKLLSLRPGEYGKVLWLAGDDNVIFVSTYRGVFMVHLGSMQFEKFFETSPFSHYDTVYPLKNLYAPGTGLANSSSGVVVSTHDSFVLKSA